MNKLYFLLAVLWLLSVRPAGAQTTDSLRLRLNQVFANVDKSQVPTGLLLAYVEQLAYLLGFDGVPADSACTTAMLHHSTST